MELLLKYFPELSDIQIKRFEKLKPLYEAWNQKINVISRKDIDELYLKHVLHSLGIAKVITFKPGTKVLDVGTGGGFPGVPLAILFPEVQFHLVDSIQKKLKVIQAVTEALSIQNITTSHSRAEALTTSYDFVVSRAVTAMPKFVGWVANKINHDHKNDLNNGILYLKGGDLTEELKSFPKAVEYDLSIYFEEAFFETKKVVYIDFSKLH